MFVWHRAAERFSEFNLLALIGVDSRSKSIRHEGCKPTNLLPIRQHFGIVDKSG